MSAKILELDALNVDNKTTGTKLPEPWRCVAVVTDDNMAYVAADATTKQVIIVDPVRGDEHTLKKVLEERFAEYRVFAVLDTHTHADHVSAAPELAKQLNVPLIMHEKSPSRRVNVRISNDTELSVGTSPLKFLLTPGHTQDSMTLIWGPLIFSGDTLLFGDCGRDDLPGGNPAEHWHSLQKIKSQAQPEMFLLPGHDGMGGRVSSWSRQLELNSALTLDLKGYENEYGSYVGPSPKLLKESLYENFK